MLCWPNETVEGWCESHCDERHSAESSLCTFSQILNLKFNLELNQPDKKCSLLWYFGGKDKFLQVANLKITGAPILVLFCCTPYKNIFMTYLAVLAVLPDLAGNQLITVEIKYHLKRCQRHNGPRNWLCDLGMPITKTGEFSEKFQGGSFLV